MSNIFSQIKVKGVNFSNRIVMAPMVHFGYKNKNGNMEEKLLNTYLNYADKGIGLIISQALLVANKKEIVGDVSNWAGIYSNEHIEYLRKISDTYHKYGTKFIAQLNTLNFKFLEKNSNDINKLSKDDLIYLRDCFIKSANKDGEVLLKEFRIIEIVAVIKKVWYNVINGCNSTVKTSKI